jgi:transferrin binding protein
MRCSRLVAQLVASASVFALIACAHGSSSGSSASSSSTPTTASPTPTSLVPTAAGIYAGPAAALSVVQGTSSLTASSTGNPNTDIATLMTPTASNTGETVTLSSMALGGGSPIALTSQGAGTQSGLTSQNYQGSFTSGSATYTFTLSDVGATANLNYSTFGQWSVNTGSNSANTSVGFYSVGSATPTASVPVTGSATYTGGALGIAVLNQSSTGYLFNGIATLTAIFSSDTISGAITSINAYSTGQPNTPVGTLNSINFTSGTIGGNGFAGSASTSSTAGTAADISGASGTFRGNFFGPAAQEAGGTFGLTNSTTNAIISGSFGAHK